MLKITYDPIRQELTDQNNNVIYKENHDAEIDLVDVIAGIATWENGDEYTLSDFCGFALDLGVEGRDYEIENK